MECSTESPGVDGDAPPFRLDNEKLAFRFTATLSDRQGVAIERLPTPNRLDDWLAANDLALGREHATTADLEVAQALREAIHRLGTATVDGNDPAASDLEILNRLLREERPVPELTPSGLRWKFKAGHHVRGALGLIAHDAATVLGGTERSHVKTCEAPECRGLFVDTSRGQNRRWCSMNICGNRAKKAKFRGSGSAA